MQKHLSEQQLTRYRQRTLPPAELISACDHLAGCAACRSEISGSEQLQDAFDALGPSLHRSVASEVSHLTRPELAAYAAARMHEPDLEIANSHLATCTECRDEVARLKVTPARDRLPKVRHLPRISAAPPAKSRFWTRQQRIRILLQAAAVAALLLLGVSTLILWGEIKRMRAEVTELERQNSQLRNELPVLSDLKAEIEKLHQSPLLSTPPELTVALNDAGGIIGLNKQGEIVGIEPLLPEQEIFLKTALSSARLPAPIGLKDVIGSDDTVMGPGERGSLRLLSPVGTATRTDRPTFRWTPLEGVSSYRVTVSDSAFRHVATSEQLSGTEWTLDRPLTRGAVYSWEVTAIKDGKEITAPVPPAREARFRVLGSAKLDELERASREHSKSHLLLGILYVTAGVLDDAEREFQSLVDANPHSDVPRRLLHSVKSLRSQKQSQSRG